MVYTSDNLSKRFQFSKQDLLHGIWDVALYGWVVVAIKALEMYESTGTVDKETMITFIVLGVVAFLKKFLQDKKRELSKQMNLAHEDVEHEIEEKAKLGK